MASRFWVAASSGSFSNVQHEVDELAAQGYAAREVLRCMLRDTLASEQMNDSQKGAIMIALAEADKCLTDGADEYLQMLNVGGRVLKALAAP